MSCYHCYSKTVRNDDLVDKIIEHGEHLKNSMIQTILNNQPTIRSNENYFNKTQLEKIQMYLRGDPMHKDDELHVLNTLRSISATELSKITNQTYYTNRSSSRSCSTTTINNNLEYFKYVDCLKININSIKLNDIGNKKVFVDKLSNITQTFFIEYKLPDKLIKNTGRIKPKIDSGLDSSTNIVRLCARRSYDQEIIIFKHSSIHDIVNNLYKFDLNEIQIKFRISYRNFRQKHPETLGHASFGFKSFKNVENLNYNQDLSINSDDNQFNVGKLKFSIQLGCERLYFGREFLEIINKNVGNTNDDDEGISKTNTPQLSPKKRIEKIPKIEDASISIRIDENLQKIDDNNPILFYLVCVFEAKFNREVCNSFVNCRMFDHELCFASKSRKSLNNLDSNPVYNFYQEVPLIYNDALLTNLRDNFMILEFLEQTGNQHFLVGLAKLSLHSFYLNFRNSIIVKYLKSNHLPVISTDGWETISNPFNHNIIGEASILLALGTKEQIDNLLNERGLKNTNNVVIVKNKLRNQSVQVDEILEKSNLLTKSSKQTSTVGVQSDMEHKDIGSLLNQLINVQKQQQQQRNIHVENSTNTDVVAVVDHPPPPPQQQQQPEIRRTSDLLDTLNKALSLSDNKNNEKKTFKCEILIDGALHLPSRKKCKSKKSKNNKNHNNNNNKHDDILLPSTYVTFEITPNNLKMTPIITKCTNPKWDYRCDILLPIEYLTNNQKRLIFKVWRKSTNTTLTPNLQTDFIIGFATVDLTVLLAGLPNIQGWYNIVDFSNKCHGQINIHITPLENISRFQQHKQQQESLNNDNKIDTTTVQIEHHDDDDDDDCNELLSRTLKRKFTELDEITQRLRLRLSKITNDNDDDGDDNITEDDVLSNNDDDVDDNDELIDEFEHDINTLCVEDDFDTIDFDKIARNFNENHIKEIGLLKQTDDDDDHEKQKIDNLVGNLSINDSSASTRHISGCSSNTNSFDTETILNQLEQNSRPNIHTTESFNRIMLEKYNWPSTSSSCSEASDNKQ